MSWAAWFWLGWLVLGFGVLETIALVTGHPEWTLSYQVWQLEGVGGSIVQFILGAFLVWLFGHLVLHLWFTLR